MLFPLLVISRSVFSFVALCSCIFQLTTLIKTHSFTLTLIFSCIDCKCLVLKINYEISSQREFLFSMVLWELKSKVINCLRRITEVRSDILNSYESFFVGQFKDHPKDLKGNNDLLCITKPDVIKAIHSVCLTKLKICNFII